MLGWHWRLASAFEEHWRDASATRSRGMTAEKQIVAKLCWIIVKDLLSERLRGGCGRRCFCSEP